MNSDKRLSIEIYKMMTFKEKRDFYISCLNPDYRLYITGLGLKTLFELVSFKNIISTPKIDKSIEKIFNNKNMLSQKYIKYSYSLGIFFFYTSFQFKCC